MAVVVVSILLSSIGDPEFEFLPFLITVLILTFVPTLLARFICKWTKGKIEDVTVTRKKYKEIPNDKYDPEFAKKMRIRIEHSYGWYTLHKYDDGTYTINDNDEFFTLHNFSFAGSDLITATNGASFGNFTKPMGYSANFASSKSRQSKGKSTITFLNASGDDTKQISAKITQNQAVDLERFFYR